jgi:hypothetical protein
MEVSGQLHAPAALSSRKESSVPIAQGIGWAPEPVWTPWREKSLAPAGNRPPAVQPVAIPFKTNPVEPTPTLEANIQLVERLSAVCGSRSYICRLWKRAPLPGLHPFPSIYNINFNIIVKTTRNVLKWSTTFKFHDQISVFITSPERQSDICIFTFGRNWGYTRSRRTGLPYLHVWDVRMCFALSHFTAVHFLYSNPVSWKLVFINVGFEVLTAVVVKSYIFWDITLCSTFKPNRSFGATCRLHLQDRKINQGRKQCESGWQGGSACNLLSLWVLTYKLKNSVTSILHTG